MNAVVCGAVATWAVGGVAWDFLQHALGLEALGFEVTYLEDAGLPGYDPAARTYTDDLSGGVEFLTATLGELCPTIAASGRWHVRGPDGRSWGLSRAAAVDAVAGADVFLNVSGQCVLREEYLASRCKVLIDTDPGWNHFVVFPRHDAGKLWPGTVGFRGHDAFFTYAGRVGRPGCRLPDLGLDWHPTRPVVATDRWEPQGPGDRWTTVLTWDNYAGGVDGVEPELGSKGSELARIETLPRRTGLPLELAVGGIDPPVERWRALGWSVVDGPTVTRTATAYRDYVARSRGECSPAKQMYAATASGWFSNRSACYLAAGRPVVLQDTGWTDWLAPGDGVLAFTTLEEAAAALAAVEAASGDHADAAGKVAATTFAAEVVLGDLLDRAGVAA